MPKEKYGNIAGTKINDCLVLETYFVVENSGTNHRYVKMLCTCGKEFAARWQSVRRGTTKSCGCKATAARILVGKANNTHGLSNTKLYHVWGNIKKRCNDPKHKHYPRYGGRGVYLSSEWVTNYKAFHDWCLENGYVEGLQLDRIDNDGPYSPENCRWTTAKENIRNASCTKLDFERVEMIRRLYHKGMSKNALSSKFEVSSSCITQIVTYKTWNDRKPLHLLDCLNLKRLYGKVDFSLLVRMYKSTPNHLLSIIDSPTWQLIPKELYT